MISNYIRVIELVCEMGENEKCDDIFMSYRKVLMYFKMLDVSVECADMYFKELDYYEKDSDTVLKICMVKDQLNEMVVVKD